MINAFALPGLSHVIVLTGKSMNCSVEDRCKCEPTIKKKSQNPYSRMQDICLRSHTALTREITTCIHSFPHPLTVNELICHSRHISQHHFKNLSIIIKLKPKHLMKYNNMNGQIQIYGTGSNSTNYSKRINIESGN
jgi:hypothetical protein